jgi:hypothetical protein
MYVSLRPTWTTAISRPAWAISWENCSYDVSTRVLPATVKQLAETISICIISCNKKCWRTTRVVLILLIPLINKTPSVFLLCHSQDVGFCSQLPLSEATRWLSKTVSHDHSHVLELFWQMRKAVPQTCQNIMTSLSYWMGRIDFLDHLSPSAVDGIPISEGWTPE